MGWIFSKKEKKRKENHSSLKHERSKLFFTCTYVDHNFNSTLDPCQNLAYCVVVLEVADTSCPWTRDSTTKAPAFHGILKEYADEWIPTAKKNAAKAASAVAGAAEAEGDWNGP